MGLPIRLRPCLSTGDGDSVEASRGGSEAGGRSEYQARLLEEIGPGERTEVQLGAQARTWHLNVTERVREGLLRLKAWELLAESR